MSAREGLNGLHQLCGIAVDTDGFRTARLPRGDPDSGLADLQIFGNELFKCTVGLVLLGHSTHTHFQPDDAGCVFNQAIDPVERGGGRQANGKLDAIL